MSKVEPPFADAALDATKACMELPGVRGVYLRGTVARGEAVEGVSDLDCVALLERGPTSTELSRVEKVAEEIGSRHTHLSGVFLELSSRSELGLSSPISAPLRFSEVGLQLVTQGVCLSGHDDIPALPRYRPGILVANNDVCQIRADINEALRAVEQDPAPDNVGYWCRRISKNIVRTGLSLTLPGGGRYARDLYPCYQAFSELYSGQESSMKRTVASALAPVTDARTLEDFLTGFGSRLTCAADAWLARHNPSEELALSLSDFPDEVAVP